MKEKEVIKYQEDLEKRYFIMVDIVTLRKTIEDLNRYQLIKVTMTYDYRLQIIAESLISMINKYKCRYA
jgi:hypothetical protein